MAKKPTAESVFARLKADAAQLERDDWQRLMQFITDDPALLGPSFRLLAMPIIWARQKRIKAASGPRESERDERILTARRAGTKVAIIASRERMTEGAVKKAYRRAAQRHGITPHD